MIQSPLTHLETYYTTNYQYISQLPALKSQWRTLKDDRTNFLCSGRLGHAKHTPELATEHSAAKAREQMHMRTSVQFLGSGQTADTGSWNWNVHGKKYFPVTSCSIVHSAVKEGTEQVSIRCTGPTSYTFDSITTVERCSVPRVPWSAVPLPTKTGGTRNLTAYVTCTEVCAAACLLSYRLIATAPIPQPHWTCSAFHQPVCRRTDTRPEFKINRSGTASHISLYASVRLR